MCGVNTQLKQKHRNCSQERKIELQYILIQKAEMYPGINMYPFNKDSKMNEIKPMLGISILFEYGTRALVQAKTHVQRAFVPIPRLKAFSTKWNEEGKAVHFLSYILSSLFLIAHF